jgi:uncharacterized RDD family membrane protein YckC
VAGLPNGVRLSSPIKRLFGYLVDYGIAMIFALLLFASLIGSWLGFSSSSGGQTGLLLILAAIIGIGYLAWFLIAMGNGQSPGKQLVGIVVVNLSASSRAGIGTMILREFLAKPVVSVLSWIALGIPLFWLMWDKDHQQL